MDFTRPERCQRQRTGREDRRSKFYEIWDNLRATHMGGYLAFACWWPAGAPSVWLANQPALQQHLAVENGR